MDIRDAKNNASVLETKTAKEKKRESIVPIKTYEKIENVKNEDITQDDMMGFFISAVDDTGLIGYSKDSFNELISNGIPQIITKSVSVDFAIKNTRDQTAKDRERESFLIHFNFSGAKAERPVYYTNPTGLEAPLYPNACRLGFQTYSGPILTSAYAKITAIYKDGRREEKEANIPQFQISAFPMMINSIGCNLYDKSREMKKALQEDPTELGGYFIIDGR